VNGLKGEKSNAYSKQIDTIDTARVSGLEMALQPRALLLEFLKKQHHSSLRQKEFLFEIQFF
jgi:hypothetical protein